MILPYFVSGGFRCFFRPINRHGKLHRLSQTITVQLPNEFIPALPNTNFQAAAVIHGNSMRLRTPILLAIKALIETAVESSCQGCLTFLAP